MQKYKDRFQDVWDYYSEQSATVSESRVLEFLTVMEKMLWRSRSSLTKSEAKALTREAFIRLVTMAKARVIHRDFLGTAYHCVLGTLRDYDRNRKELNEREIIVDFHAFNMGHEESAEHTVAQRETIRTIQQALAKLNERDSAILLRHYGYKEKLVDIAKDLGIPDDQISMYRTRALRRLATLLESEKDQLFTCTSINMAKPKTVPKAEY